MNLAHRATVARESGAAPSVPTSAKIVIAGGFGVGKTTLVGSISEIRPVRTEAPMTVAAAAVDDIALTPGKTSTTIAMDFGRITLADDMILYLFGTPGQARFWFMWDELVKGAIGGVILVDARRITDCFSSLDYFERRGLPYIIGINCFGGSQPYALLELRESLGVGPDIPILSCDVRQRESTKLLLITLVKHAMSRRGDD